MRRFVIVILISASLPGFVSIAFGEKEKAKEPLPSHLILPPQDDYVYSSEGKRDPFRSLLLGRKNKEMRVEEIKKLDLLRKKAQSEETLRRELAKIPYTPLQEYDIRSLKLTVVLSGSMGDFALIEAPDGKGYTVKEGSYVGNKYGLIKKVEKDHLVIEEKYISDDAKIKKRKVKLKLREEEE